MARSNRLVVALLAAFAPSLLAGCRAGTAATTTSGEPFTPAGQPHRLPRTLPGAMDTLAPQAKDEFGPTCASAGIAWPPARITLLAFKQERVLEVWGANTTGRYALLARYPILAASGKLGPKLREGDMQVPEGIYRIDSLNPASHFHLSLHVAYPNADDIANASVPRARMGGDIYVHGNAVSAGCVAIGDAAIERVFALVALAHPNQRRIIIVPVDFRITPDGGPQAQQEWVRELYGQLRKELTTFRGNHRTSAP